MCRGSSKGHLLTDWRGCLGLSTPRSRTRWPSASWAPSTISWLWILPSNGPHGSPNSKPRRNA